MIHITAEHVKAFRRSFDLTQDQASKLAGVSRVTWNRWEAGHIPAYVYHILRSISAQLKEGTK